MKVLLRLKLTLLTFILFTTVFNGYFLSSTPKVSALSGSSFQAGRIIDNSVFFNGNSLSASQIQTFLNSKVPACDTDGSQPYAGTTRAAYGTSRGYPPPYTCLKDYRQNVPARSPEDSFCNGITAASNRTAAQIIDTVARSCGISQKVLIVLLEKEQSLVTDEWPWSIQYRSATGYGCPDTAPCDSEYYGFFNQVYNAARIFKYYARYPDSFNYIAGINNYILYNPNTSCGGSNVFIQNQATAGLYNYTPYQPNSAALNNLYGTGNSCSSYGNRNFWRLFYDWFGDPLTPALSVGWLNISKDTEPGENVSARFWIRNNTKNSIDLGRLKIIVRSENGNSDFPSVEGVVIKPGATFSYSKSRVLAEEGNYTFKIGRYDDGRWQDPLLDDFNIDYDLVVNRKVYYQPTIIASSLPTQTHANQNATATFRIKNNSQIAAVDIGRVKLAMRFSNGANSDFPSSPEITLDPGEEYLYSAQKAPATKGQYSYWITNYRDGIGWSNSFPENESTSIKRSGKLEVRDQVTVTASSLPSASHRSTDTTVSFTLRNHGTTAVNIGNTKVAVRNTAGRAFDFGPSSKEVLQAGESYTYTQTRKFGRGIYYLWIANHRDGIGWSNQFPVAEFLSVKKSMTLRVKDSVTVTQAVMPAAGLRNQAVNSQVIVKNFSDESVYIGRIKFAVRSSGGENFDFPSSPDLTLSPGQQYTYSVTRSFATSGVYTYWLVNFRTGYGWSDVYPESENASIKRSGTLPIN